MSRAPRTAGSTARTGAGRRATRCISNAPRPARALTVAPTGLVFHHPDGSDVAVRVLSAIAFPEVWPGWRGNALIGDFHRDFLQPGCPVLTALTIVTGDEAAGERAFLKSARATQQAGTGLARYLPGLPEKARDWQVVTERLKDGERAGPGLLHGRGLRTARCDRRGRAGGARDLSRSGLARGRRALCPAPLLAHLPADGAGGRARRRPRPHGPG